MEEDTGSPTLVISPNSVIAELRELLGAATYDLVLERSARKQLEGELSQTRAMMDALAESRGVEGG